MKYNIQENRRKKRTRSKIKRSHKKRLSVFRSNRFIFAQVIDDAASITLLSVSEKQLPTSDTKLSKIEKAKKMGIILAKKALEKKIESVVFDRGSYAYHGRIKAFADGAREGGLKF